MHLAGLVHDLGKVMSMWGEEQFATTGQNLSAFHSLITITLMGTFPLKMSF